MSLNKIPVPGYPFTGAVKRAQWFGDLTGNSNYQQGGDTLYATDFGMGGIENLMVEFSGFSQSNSYFARVRPPASASVYTETSAPVYNNVTLIWYYTANNAQVASNSNLAAEVVRINVRGV